MPDDGRALEQVVLAARSQADAQARRLLVYVGAEWCEPCKHFHKAVEAGQLDEALAGVRFLELDADRDADRIEAAGYDGRLIPRFAVPGQDGRGNQLKIEGGVKGEAAVDHIMARLEPLVARAPR